MRILRNPRIRTFVRGTLDFGHEFLEVAFSKKKAVWDAFLGVWNIKKQNEI